MILITGGTGFIGCFLAHRFLQEGREVTIAGGPHPESPPWPWTPEMAKRHLVVDVRDRQAVFDVVRRTKPEEVYHLAAQSRPTVSWEQPELTMDTNVTGTVHLFEGLKAAGLKPRVFVACSSAEYGLVPPKETPTREDRVLEPVHPYGVSKVAQDLLAYQYWINDGIPAIRGRIFNTTGPGKSRDAPGDFADRVHEAEKAGGGVVRVGNLETLRDLSDVRDQARAIVDITRKGKPGEPYNLCTGRTIKIRNLVDVFLTKARAPVKIQEDRALFRTTDEPVIVGNNARLVAVTGYAPRVPIERTVEDMLLQRRGEPVPGITDAQPIKRV